MEMKVRLLDGTEEKGTAQVEQELLEQHEQQQQQQEQQQEVQQEQQQEVRQEQEVELNEQQVLSYIGKRYNKQINSLDELTAQRQETEALPEDVAAYMKYKKETGRGFEDFISLKKDFDTMNPEQLLKEYLRSTQDGLDSDDIEELMEDYRYDEDIDDESTIKRVKITTKKAIAEAKKFFNTQKEKYKMPLESSQALVSDEEKEEYQSYKQYLNEAKTIEEENIRKRQWFDQKTNDVFNGDFKGFDFNVDDKKITFSPGNPSELKRLQSTPSNFINKFLDDNGLVKDAVGYHKSLAVAMNPDNFAKFFYEQGKADAVEGTMKNIKNIQMSEHKVPEISKLKDGIQVKSVNPDSGRSLKIRSIKKI
jgi:hypothetical protein